MKILLSLPILIFSVLSASAQGCLPQGITFYTQQEIDNFQNLYPDCHEILGEVQIFGGNNISHLDGLAGIEGIAGNLTILMCNGLTSLSGLENLAFIGGDLKISQNSQLISLTALSGLNAVEGSVELTGNNQLNGLQGLENINTGAVSDLLIHDNPQLSICDIENICSYLSFPKGHVVIYNNGEGCRNPPDIALHCGLTLSCLPYGDYYLTSQSDIDHFAEDYSHCTHPEGVVKISGNDITHLDGLNEITSAGMYLTIVQNPQLTSLSGLMNLQTVSGALSIGDNPLLTTLSGLENLTGIGGYLSVYNNSSLNSLEGINNLTSAGGWLEIMNNEQLANVEGLSRLASVGSEIAIRHNTALQSLAGLGSLDPATISYLTVVYNYSLSACETEGICLYLADPSGITEIHDNAPGCNSLQEVEDACESLGTSYYVSNTRNEIIYNPITEKVLLLFAEPSLPSLVTFSDLIGKTIFTTRIIKDSYELDLGPVHQGLYLIRIENEYGTNMIKLFKP